MTSSVFVILTVGNDAALATAREALLRLAGYHVMHVTPQECLRTFRSGDYDLVLFCSSVPETLRISLICAMKSQRPMLPVITTEEEHGAHTPLANDSVDSLAPPEEMLSKVLHLLIAERHGWNLTSLPEKFD